MHRSRLTYFHNNIKILMGFKNATLTSSYIYFKRHLYVKFLRSDDVIMKWLLSQLLNSNCTAKLDDVIEILSNRMNGYIQINVKTANLAYHKPANQNECFFSMTNKVHSTHLMLLGSLVVLRSFRPEFFNFSFYRPDRPEFSKLKKKKKYFFSILFFVIAPARRYLVRYINFTNTSFHFVGFRRVNIDCSSKAVVRDAFPESREPVQSKTHLHNHPISSCYLRVRKQNGLPAKLRS